ncbi:MAG: DUF1887 family protein [Ruminococcaceae bacterium]|nr:DUF1887 family protein [Oscillospiraceae bacterium]
MDTARTLVEFYDHDPLENIVSLLRGTYRKVVFVYFARANEPDPQERRALTRWVEKRFDIPCRFLGLPEHCISCALEHFHALLKEEGSCDFDITGGSSVFIAAAGMLLAHYGAERMRLHEYDPASGACLYRHPDEGTERADVAGTLAVTEFLKLRDIALLDGGTPIRYDLDAHGLGRDLTRLWESVRGNLRAWNAFCNTASEFYRENGRVVMEKEMTEGQYRGCQMIFRLLEKSGLLHSLQESREHDRMRITACLEIAYTSAFLYEKAGNLLELMMYRAARDCGLFADCCTGVKLDWNGRPQRGSNPNNEIDLVLTRGHVPCFVSCKNTNVTKEYLYEIMTMTRHFGGIHAVPMVFSTMRAEDAVRARAAEMGVVLMDSIGKIPAARLAGCLRETCAPRGRSNGT